MSQTQTHAGLARLQIAQRVAQDLQDGAVEPGIGMPELVANFVPKD